MPENFFPHRINRPVPDYIIHHSLKARVPLQREIHVRIFVFYLKCLLALVSTYLCPFFNKCVFWNIIIDLSQFRWRESILPKYISIKTDFENVLYLIKIKLEGKNTLWDIYKVWNSFGEVVKINWACLWYLYTIGYY